MMAKKSASKMLDNNIRCGMNPGENDDQGCQFQQNMHTRFIGLSGYTMKFSLNYVFSKCSC